MDSLLRKARIALTPRAWLLKRTLANGAIVYGRNVAGHGARGIYLLGDRMRPELEHLESFLPRDGVLIDVGANTGIFTLKAARHFDDSGVVIAVEPGIEMLHMLAYSVRANGFSNVRLRNFCIGQSTSEAKLWLNYDKPNAFSLNKRAEGASNVSVLVVTLDQLCEWEGLTRLDYVKIDVVGAEQQVLDGAARSLQRFKPVIQVAVHTGYVPPRLPGYSILQSQDPRKETVLYMPSGDERGNAARALGWEEIRAG